LKKLIKRLLVIGLLVFVIYNLINLFASEKTSVIAELETMEVSYNLDGIIIRDEKLISLKAKEGGILDVSVAESEMVPKGKLVATYYDSSIDDKTKSELNKINESISNLVKATNDTIAQEMSVKEIEEEIDSKINDIAYASSDRNMAVISLLKSEVNELIGKRNAGEFDETPVSERLEKLKQEKSAIERKYSGTKSEIIAPQHGVFSTRIDGFEDTLTPDIAQSITVTDYENAKKQKISADDIRKKGAVCKIVDNSLWYVSVIADEEIAKSFEVDDNVVIHFQGDSTDVKGKIEYISHVQDGKYMITISSSSYCSYAMETRFATLTVIKESNTGLKIPLSVIRVKDGKSGVYVKTENTVKYREIDVLAKDDKYAIVKFDNTKSNALLLYDEVIVDN